MTDGFWQHQTDEIVNHTDEPFRALFWEARSGKTRTIVEQLKRKNFKRVIISSTIMALRMAWKEELKALGDVYVADLTEGPLGDREEALKLLTGLQVPVVALVNLEAVPKLEAALLKFKAQAVIVDEAHLIKTVSSQRAVAISKIGRKAQWRRILTGTPTPKNYVDLYSQFKFLDPEVFGTNKAIFEERYCVMHPHWQSQIIGYKNLPDLDRRVLTRTTKIVRANCFDVPEVLEVPYEVTLPPSVQRDYDKLVAAQLVELKGLGEDGTIQTVTANGTHRLARFTKLQQLTAGFVANPGGELVVWAHREKLAACVDALGEHVENGEYVVVSYWFRHEGAELERTLTKFFGDAAIVSRLSGDTPQSDRAGIAAPFALGASGPNNRQPVARILIVQEKVGGLGISLARANHMVFTSTSLDAASHSQMRDRIWAPSKKITYTYIRVPRSIDFWVKGILEKKISAQEALMNVGFKRAAYGEIE